MKNQRKWTLLILSYLFIFSICLDAQAREFSFGKVKISITQTEQGKNGERDGAIEVRRLDGSIAKKSFKKMEALGGSNGFSIPKKQPLTNLFFVVKEGDYDSRLLAITEKGEILDLPFGDTYSDSATLYSIRNDEVQDPAFAVVDLTTMKIIKTGISLSTKEKKVMKKMKPTFQGLFYQAWSPVKS